ncbi:MAG: conserved membrane protein of unknown function [Promethearchaeota archaeon]|nr:MAG: conserved membrane protein of unknown function [Candidatus Lokiarchaeota archaeon]
MIFQIDYLVVLNGIFSILYVGISVFIGLLMISKYFKHRETLLILVGITWIGLVSPWYPSSVSFISYLLTGEGISLELYLIIGNVAAPFILIIWIYAFTDLLYPSKKKLAMLIMVLYTIAFETIFFYFLLTDPTSLGTLHPPIDVEFKFLMLGFAVSIILIMLFTGIIFARESLRSNNPELKLKGKFLYAAFFSYTLGAVLDAAIPLNPITLTLARIILISSAIEWYFGFILPEKVKKIFLK